ncbi:uncharacterized protein VTP21DRAFT_1255 [Calcarisporiella thermophila]|uniref:uncharacterized protein n=1 Tax=Calcarisporiella thermophila TaxID=911321 RepID=UPI0037420012
MAMHAFLNGSLVLSFKQNDLSIPTITKQKRESRVFGNKSAGGRGGRGGEWRREEGKRAGNKKKKLGNRQKERVFLYNFTIT